MHAQTHSKTDPAEIQRRRRVILDAMLLLYKKYKTVSPDDLDNMVGRVENDAHRLVSISKELASKALDSGERDVLVQLQARARLASLHAFEQSMPLRSRSLRKRDSPSTSNTGRVPQSA